MRGRSLKIDFIDRKSFKYVARAKNIFLISKITFGWQQKMFFFKTLLNFFKVI